MRRHETPDPRERELEGWTPIDPSGIVHTAPYRFPGGVSRSMIVRLADDCFLVYSPGRELARSAEAILGRDSEVFLLAPATSHTLGVASWRTAFPRARVVASHVAAPKARKRVQAVEGLDALVSRLPTHVSLHELPACRFGEVWISVQVDERVYWLVCDAFVNISTLPSNPLIRLLMRLYRLGPGLEVTRVYQYRGFRDRPAFCAWVANQLAVEDLHHVLVPCHGQIDDGPALRDRVLRLVQRRF